MKKTTMTVIMALPVLALAQSVAIKADREAYVYACGDPAAFSIQVLDKDNQPVKAGQLRVTLTNFGTQQIANATFDLAKANPAICKGTLQEPGFLKCMASVKLDKDYRGISGVAYDPEKITAGSLRPADFDAFWDAAIKKLDAEVPLDPRMRVWKSSVTSNTSALE